MKIFVMGASGFVGSKVANAISLLNHELLLGARGDITFNSGNVECVKLNLASSKEADYDFLASVDVVVHSAARVHVMTDSSPDPLAEFRAVNSLGTLELAKNSAKMGVKRFVFISSIKVNGESTSTGNPFTEIDIPDPKDPYGISKYEAEVALLELAKKTNMEVVIIRPPLVYGPGVKANFRSMMAWLYKGFPLPLGAIHNKRSLVYIDNLVDFVVMCISHPAAANNIFLVSDGEDLSTSDLLRRMGTALGYPARLIPIPSGLLKFGATVSGKGAIAQRLCGSLQVDISKARTILGWIPPVSVDRGLKETAVAFVEEVPR